LNNEDEAIALIAYCLVISLSYSAYNVYIVQ